MRQAEELEFSVYDFEQADATVCRKILDLYEGEALRLLEEYRAGEKRKTTSEKRSSKPETRNSKAEDRTLEGVAKGTLAASSPCSYNDQIESVKDESSCHALDQARFPLRKVYDLTLKCSHLFNILDARGAISVTERVALIGRVRKLACAVAEIYRERQAAIEVTA